MLSGHRYRRGTRPKVRGVRQIIWGNPPVGSPNFVSAFHLPAVANHVDAGEVALVLQVPHGPLRLPAGFVSAVPMPVMAVLDEHDVVIIVPLLREVLRDEAARARLN